MSQKHITIVGAGLVGSLLSIYLAKRGHTVHVFERRPDMRSAHIPAGRSINLAMSERGWRGLERAGIIEEIRKIAIPMTGRMMHDVQGNLAYQPYGDGDQAINSVSRRDLNITLMNCAERFPDVHFHFDERALDIALDKPAVEFVHNVSGVHTTVESDVVIGSDGAFSAIREKIMKATRCNYSQDYLEHGYKELSIPPGPNGSFQMEKNALHIWARKSFMLIALPNTDGTFTCTLFYPYHGQDSFENIKTEQDVVDLFTREFPDALALMPTLVHDFFANPTGSLATMRTFPWVWQDKVALIGDAAHAIVPFYGQGMNCGFEDCVTFAESIDAHPNDWTKAFDAYQRDRKPNADAIAQLAINNFTEMRDKVADARFLLRKKIESMMHKEFPDRYVPQYTLVSFSPDVSYAEAYERGFVNDALLERIMDRPDIESTWNTPEVKSLIADLLQAQ